MINYEKSVALRKKITPNSDSASQNQIISSAGINATKRSGVRFQGRSNWTQCRQRLATAATVFRSSVTPALSRRDGPRHSKHASA